MTKYFSEDMLNKITDDEDNSPNIPLIVEECFMDKDVSELVKGDYYLFLVFNDIVYMYKDYSVKGWSEHGVVYRAKYTSGTLKNLADKLEFGL